MAGPQTRFLDFSFHPQEEGQEKEVAELIATRYAFKATRVLDKR